MKQLFGEWYDDIFSYTDVCEVRLTAGRPLVVVTRGRAHTLSVTCTSGGLRRMLDVATEYSVYAAVPRLIAGYLPYAGGVRIGIAGRYALQNGALHHLDGVTGLVVRLPHQVNGCSEMLDIGRAYGRNILVVSPPFCGKTTFVRDLAVRLSAICSVVLLDERDELSGGGKLSIGEAMPLSGVPKEYLYRGVLRALDPTYVVTDELDLPGDLDMVRYLSSAGVSVAATVHGDRSRYLDGALGALFPVRVLLSRTPTVGHVEEVSYA